MRGVKLSRNTAKAGLAVAMAGAMLAATPAATGMSAGQAVGGLNGPRGVAMGPGGKVVVTQADGSFSKVVQKGPNKGKVIRLGKVPENFLAPAVDINNKGQVFLLTLGGPTEGAGTLYRYTPGKGRQMIADIMKYQKRDPDPADLENKARESNPYGVAALNDGSALVADAAGNDLLRVWPDGTIKTVARVKPRTVKAPDMGPDGPPAGTPIPSEAVVTSVAVGPDGSYYIGELRGFPGNPGKSQVWRIEPGAKRTVVCNPKRPNRGKCTRYADGLTSIMDLAVGRGGALYVAEMSKKGWLAVESGDPEAMVGSVIRIGHDTQVRRELGKNLMVPGGIEVGNGGAVFVTTPMMGRGELKRIR